MKILENQILGKYGTFQVGGPADYFAAVNTEAEFLEAMEWAAERDLPYFVFGGGTNLLFDDAGFRGLVIHMRAKEVRVNGNLIYADAGAQSGQVVSAAAKAGLTGLEAWKGLPGTVGGAVFGNAGCFGVETKDILKTARVWRPGEEVMDMNVDELEYDYRSSVLKREPGVVLSAVFELKTGDPDAIQAGMKEVAELRRSKQPPGLTTGSFFKNPSDHPAGWLIDQCGLKGHQIGGAQVSEYHGNFFMNTGSATAADILELSDFVQKKVQEKFGITLEQELICVPSE